MDQVPFTMLVAEALAADFSGWDFSWLRGRLTEGALPWDYLRLAADALATCQDALDIGTGGGERLAALGPPAGHTTATESYPPNVPVARARLAPLGVTVVETPEDTLPFRDGAFDLVLDRHTGAPAAEVARVLRPGGRLLTQQVGEQHNRELVAFLTDGAQQPAAPLLPAMTQALTHAGLVIQAAREARPAGAFADIGAVVYYLQAIPWVVEGFGVDSHRPALLRLHRWIRRRGPFPVTGHGLLIHAIRP